MESNVSNCQRLGRENKTVFLRAGNAGFSVQKYQKRYCPYNKKFIRSKPRIGSNANNRLGRLAKKALRFFHGKSSHSKIPRQRDSGQYPNEQRLDKSRGARKHGRPQSDKRTPIYMGFKNVHIDNS